MPLWGLGLLGLLVDANYTPHPAHLTTWVAMVCRDVQRLLPTATLIFLSAMAACWWMSLLINGYSQRRPYSRLLQSQRGIQNNHAIPTPRIGGIGIVVGLLMGALICSASAAAHSRSIVLLMLVVTPAFLGGLLEDLTGRVSPAKRMAFTMVSAALGIWLMGTVVTRVDIPMLDALLHWTPVAILFTLFAISGVTNAINIIDGVNGLASGFVLLSTLMIAWVASQVGDSHVVCLALGVAGATLGFVGWNWPKAKLFLGDGGAYLLGIILAELSLLLVTRNPSVSPWLPVLLLAYPIYETVYSIYRRRWVSKCAISAPDVAHLHHMIQHKLTHRQLRQLQVAPVVVGTVQPLTPCFKQTFQIKNARVAPYILAVVGCVDLMATQMWQSSAQLMVAIVVVCGLYTLIYKKIAQSLAKLS